MKKLWSIMLAVLLVLGSSLTCFADSDAEHVITIENEKKGHVYEAFQIFAGDLNKDNSILSNVEWGTGVDGESLLAALKEDENSIYSACTNAEETARVLSNFENDSEVLDAFAKAAANCLLTAAGTSVEEEGSYKITVYGDGYYFVKDAAEVTFGDAYTKYILQVVKNVTVSAKAGAPALEKHILDGETAVEAKSAAVGDRVSFMITSAVPDMNGYNKYFYILHDSMDQGLTFEADTVKIKIGDLTLETDAYQVITENLEDNCSFEIVLNDFVQYKEQKDTPIVITYEATVNTNAVIGTTGNANRAHLEYSNNPNLEAEGIEGNPDRPEIGDSTGVTPDETAVVYLTGIELLKVDASEEPLVLTGAQFKITGDRINKVLVCKGVYKEAENGIYYKLTDGSYTESAPVTGAEDRYDDTETMYSLEYVEEWVTVTEEMETTAYVDGSGQLSFQGLSEGTYVISEIVAPNGYNLLKEAIIVTVTCQVPETIDTGFEDALWKYTVEGALNVDETSAESGVVKLTVVNQKGITLPATGGAGIYGCLIAGVCFLAAAAWMHVGRKREEEV